ncbi:MAG: glycogen synthase GlgA [Myxococcota bacterium]|nr:glycogen synthase GlgA [Myxococcota bacterium]MDW8364041.1 glycogen synthase GlgA [Myxococcales bacterium]
MNLLFASAELAPFAKTGGLADVCAALPRALAARGHDVRPFLPLYRRVLESGVRPVPVRGLQGLSMRIGARALRFSIAAAALPGSEMPVYFVNCPSLYDRPGIYTRDPDEHVRFVALGWAALVAAQHMGFRPDVVHVHDWHTAIVPLLMKVRFGWDRLFARSRTVLTIHNLAHQGIVPAAALPDTGLGDAAHLFHQDHLREGWFGFLETGVLYADAVSTVSPTYAREIQTNEGGGRLAPLLRARSSTVVGILNGIDEDAWNPATDPHLPARYGPDDLSGKLLCKRALLGELGLPFDPAVPVAGVVARLTAQKGLELVLDAVPPLLEAGRLQLVVLGSGAPFYERGFEALARRFPRAVAFRRGFSERLAHRIEAGADLFLMPSRFEPCGLNQMYSMRYGTPPVVRRTGGLADTVTHFDRRSARGTGFVFEHFDAAGLRWALGEALACWQDRPAWATLVRNAMAGRFGWNVRVERYERLYESLSRS